MLRGEKRKVASRSLLDCVQLLQSKVPLIIADYQAQFPTRELRVICSLRSTIEQQQIFAIGRTVPPIGVRFWRTKVDGVTKFSKHNPDPNEPLSKAVDFGVFVGGKYITTDSFYYPLLDLARKYNLISGIDFFNRGFPLEDCLSLPEFHDVPHVEVPGPLYHPPVTQG